MHLEHIYVHHMTHNVSLADRQAFEASVDALGRDVPVAVALTDLDGFGPLNDAYGRAAGDAARRAHERTLSGSPPREAVVTRIGGDEYAIALPTATAESALILLDEVRQHVSSRPATAKVPDHLD